MRLQKKQNLKKKQKKCNKHVKILICEKTQVNKGGGGKLLQILQEEESYEIETLVSEVK